MMNLSTSSVRFFSLLPHRLVRSLPFPSPLRHRSLYFSFFFTPEQQCHCSSFPIPPRPTWSPSSGRTPPPVDMSFLVLQWFSNLDLLQPYITLHIWLLPISGGCFLFQMEFRYVCLNLCSFCFCSRLVQSLDIIRSLV
jgi:hypothetical protein